MTERIHELLLRNLQEVFGEGDATKGRSAINELYTDDCVLLYVFYPPGPLDALPKISALPIPVFNQPVRHPARQVVRKCH